MPPGPGRCRAVKEVVDLGNGIAVIATNTWYAMEAARAVRIEWGPAPYPATTEGHWKAVEDSFTEERLESVHRDDGNVARALTGEKTGEVIELEYRAPYLAHATMEPMNAVAWLRDGKLDVWAGNQAPTFARQFAAESAGLDEADVTVHTTYLGGGFGRRAELDFVRLAVRVALAAEGTPVKTTWSREEDTTATTSTARWPSAGSGPAWSPAASPRRWTSRLSAPGASDSFMARAGVSSPGPDSHDHPGGLGPALWHPELSRRPPTRCPSLLPLGFWRSVGASQNAFFHESAHGRDGAWPPGPGPGRDASGDDDARAEPEACWRPWPRWPAGTADMVGEGRGRGVAYALSFGVPVAEIVEVAVTDAGASGSPTSGPRPMWASRWTRATSRRR